MSRLTSTFLLSLLLLAPFASADIPRLISLQGRLTDASNNPITSASDLIFRIYNAETGGASLWTEEWIASKGRAITPSDNGIFSVLLGSATALSIPFNESYWLEVQVQSGMGPMQTLSPRTRMGSAGYALRSENPWNTTGNNIYTTNAGNVGIGTASPAQKLDVAGKIKIADGTQGAGKVLTSDANGVASWQAASGGNASYPINLSNPLHVKKVVSLSSVTRNANDGQVSTASPTYINVKNFTLNGELKGSVRFYFELITPSFNTVYAKVYKNGVAIGTEKTSTADGYVSFTDDINIGTMQPGETLELWMHLDGVNTGYARNFRMQYDLDPTIPTTNS